MRSRIDRCSSSPSALSTRRGARGRKKVPGPRRAPGIGAPAPSGNRSPQSPGNGRPWRTAWPSIRFSGAFDGGHAAGPCESRHRHRHVCPETRLAPASRASRRRDSTGSANRQCYSRQWPDRGNHGEHARPDGHRGIPSPSAPAATGPDRAGGPGSRQRPGHPAPRSARERGSDGA